jgi:isoleucyl-tRNA synthetase
LQIPEYNDKLLNESIEKRFERMQSAIENGRLIREKKNINLKTPLREVVLID